jgi:hypothetical protein
LKHQKGSKDCYYCKRNFPTQEPSTSEKLTSAPSLPKNFETYQNKVEHHGQHPDCSECLDLAVPSIKMMDYPLPRSGKEKRTELPYRNLGPGNHNPKFQNNLVADLDFIQYRKADAEPSQDIIRMQNYANYQSVCLAQNIDDIAQDVMKTKGHMNGLHAELDQITQNQDDLKTQLHTILEKLDIIEKAVENMKASYQEESQPASPVLIPSNDATFSFFSSSPPSEIRTLTLKQLASSLKNPTLVRIAEICQLAYDKLALVKGQFNELEAQVIQAKADNLSSQLALVNISTDQSFSIKAMEGETKPEPEAESSKPSSSRTSAWEQWCNSRYSGSKKAPMDIDGQPQTSIKHTDTAPVSNVDCKSKLEIEIMIQGWHAWAKTQKLFFKDKVTWSDLALRITWGFTGNLHFWWERITDN